MDALLKALELGATVVTVNSRLARLVRMQYASRMNAQGQRAWATPDVLSMKQWIARAWDVYLDHLPADLPEELTLPLDQAQENAVWEAVVTSTEAGKMLLQISGAAEAACKAYALLRQYGLTLKNLTNLGSSEPAYFRAWAEAFERRCAEMGRQSAADLPARIAELIASGSIDVGRDVWFAGFDRVTPVDNRLREVMRARGINVGEWQPEPVAASSRARISFPTEKDELAAAAAWAHSVARDQYDAHIGIVVPELHKCAAQVRRAFLEEFHPEAVACGRVPRQTAFNISYGSALIDEPVVRAALLLLEATASPIIPFETASRLLLTPYLFGGGVNNAQRGLTDFVLRDQGGIETNFKIIASLLNSSGAMNAARKVQNVGAIPIPPDDEVQLPGVWMERFLLTLEAGAWTIGARLDSREQQAVDAWRGELARLEQLDDVVEPESMEETLDRLVRFCTQRIFQPEGSSARLQIMGLLEANNLSFTHLWVVGMHDGVWPPGASPTPFLPLRMQVRYNMGNATPALAYTFAKSITDRLMASAPTIIASWPRRDDTSELRPSPFLGSLPETTLAALKIPPRTALETALLQGAPQMEIFPDPVGPALVKGVLVSGGTRLLKDQSECPFRAFATHRLGAEELPSPSMGMDPRARGSIVHDVLEQVWSALEDSDTLQNTTDEALRELVAGITSKAVESRLAERLDLAKTARALETRRTIEVVMEWMEWERRREQSFRVEMVEDHAVGEVAPQNAAMDESDASLRNERIVVDLGAIKIHAQRDRVDSVYDDDDPAMEAPKYLVIDYKTGNIDSVTKAWDEEQPTEPQLLAYIAGTVEPVDFIALAKVRKGECRFQGLGREELRITKLNARQKSTFKAADDWDAKVASWTGTLQRLGTEFQTGLAEVNPRVPHACDYCPLPMFCRIHERENADAILDEDSNNGADEWTTGEENA